MFRITNSTLMDRKYPNALAYIKIEAVIRVKQKLWAVKIWAKMIWKQPSSFELPSVFHKQYMNVQSCIMSTSMSINSGQFFRRTNPQNSEIVYFVISIKVKRGVMSDYLRNTSQFIHFQSDLQKK